MSLVEHHKRISKSKYYYINYYKKNRFILLTILYFLYIYIKSKTILYYNVQIKKYLG